MIAALLTCIIFCSFSAAAEAAEFVGGVFQLGIFDRGIVSLMYHKISENKTEQNAFCISPEMFEEDIRYFKEQGYRFLTASEADGALADRRNREKYVVITFDDGYESDYLYALPILEKYNAKATFFVIYSQIGKEDHITAAHLKELSQSSCVEIGSHSGQLHNKTKEELQQIFYSGNTEEIVKDFKESAANLEKLTGKPVRTLSYPNGIWNTAADTALREAGFSATFTSEAKRITKTKTPHGRINRYTDFTLSELLAK